MARIRSRNSNLSAGKIILLQIAFCCLIVMSSSCFITNCPPGGKRASLLDGKPARQCSRCGPGGTGHCFGPDICCGPDFGCFIKPTSVLGAEPVNSATLNSYSICKTEDLHPLPCRLPGKSCGGEAFEGGRCAVNGLCCAIDRCVLDETCDDVAELSPKKESSDWLRAYIQRRPAYDIQMNTASK